MLADETPATDGEARTITLSYFNAVDEQIVQAYLDELTHGLAAYDITLTIVDYETDDPAAHVLIRPTNTRDGEADYGTTYVLNLFKTPFSDLSHGLDITLTETAVVFGGAPDKSALLTLAILLMISEDCPNAVKVLDEVAGVASSPLWDDHIRFYRGHCALLQADYPAAIQHFQDVLYAPNGEYYYASALGLAYAYIQNEQTVEATILLQSIGDSIAVWSLEYSEVMARRAALYAELGDLNMALESVLAAVSVDQMYRAALYERGMIFNALGDVAAAQSDLIAYLDLAPDGEYAEQARAWLEAVDS